jgi:RNA polymerase sigma-70 factor (ECF subfamily)
VSEEKERKGTETDCFVTTRWTVVREAGKSGDAPGAQAALETLCRTYWFPLYAYVRRRGYGPHDAEDLVQGFFARLIRLNSLGGTDRTKGKFRAFLLAGMNHYLADEWGRSVAAKRDVRKTVFLDAMEAENRYALEPVDRLTPELAFDRQWALSLLAHVVQRLRGEYARTARRRCSTDWLSR